jgi:hypothetical protein
MSRRWPISLLAAPPPLPLDRPQWRRPRPPKVVRGNSQRTWWEAWHRRPSLVAGDAGRRGGGPGLRWRGWQAGRGVARAARPASSKWCDSGVLGRHRRSLSRLRVQWADPGPLRPDLMRWLGVGLRRAVRRARQSVLLLQRYRAVASTGIRCLCA